MVLPLVRVFLVTTLLAAAVVHAGDAREKSDGSGQVHIVWDGKGGDKFFPPYTLNKYEVTPDVEYHEVEMPEHD